MKVTDENMQTAIALIQTWGCLRTPPSTPAGLITLAKMLVRISSTEQDMEWFADLVASTREYWPTPMDMYNLYFQFRRPEFNPNTDFGRDQYETSRKKERADE